MKKAIVYFLFLVGFVVVLLFAFNQQIKYAVMDHKIEDFRQQVSTITPEEITQNKKKPATFDFDQVESISDSSVAQSQIDLLTSNVSEEEFNTVGFIAVPSVGINLPIFQGVSNANLLYGAGTAKENQALGTGNYTLASHRTVEPYLLFTPLSRVEMGASIYVTDASKVYEYKVSDILVVLPNRGDLLDDVKNEKLITLVTCDDIGGQRRLVVRGKFEQAIDFDKVPSSIKEAFNMPTQTY